MKTLIWLGCAVVAGIFSVLIDYAGIKLGAIPSIIVFSPFFWIADRLCKRWEEKHPEKRKLSRKEKQRKEWRELEHDNILAVHGRASESETDPEPSPVSEQETDPEPSPTAEQETDPKPSPVSEQETDPEPYSGVSVVRSVFIAIFELFVCAVLFLVFGGIAMYLIRIAAGIPLVGGSAADAPEWLEYVECAVSGVLCVPICIFLAYAFGRKISKSKSNAKLGHSIFTVLLIAFSCFMAFSNVLLRVWSTVLLHVIIIVIATLSYLISVGKMPPLLGAKQHISGIKQRFFGAKRDTALAVLWSAAGVTVTLTVFGLIMRMYVIALLGAALALGAFVGLLRLYPRQ